MVSFQPSPWFAPQPVVIIGTYDKEGRPCAMNAAWAGQWGMDKIFISLGSHATTDNLELTDDFTIAFATKETLVAADYVGMVSARKDPNKLAKTNWGSACGTNVKAPVFNVFPMTFECKVEKKLDKSASGYYLIGKIVNILCDEKYLATDGKPDLTKMNLITYDGAHHRYIALGEAVGKAFSDGKQLM